MNFNIYYENINDGHVRNIEMYLLLILKIYKIYMKLLVKGFKRDECIGKY